MPQTTLSSDQTLAASDQLLRDYQLLVHEKEAIIAWLDQKLTLSSAHISAAEEFEEIHQARQINHGLLEMRGDMRRQLERYREYIDGLRHRQRQIQKEATS